MDPLIQVPKEQISKLIDSLKEDLPLSALVYSWINNALEWQKKTPNLEIEILTPRNGNLETASFIAYMKGLALDDKVIAVVYSREGGIENLREALDTSTLVPWDQLLHFTGVLSQNWKVLAPVFQNKGFTEDSCFLHYMSAEEAAQIKVPAPAPDVHVAPLNADLHLDTVCSTWPHFVESMRPVMRAVITNNFTSGVFLQGKLVSMVLRTYHGGIGALQTLPEYQGRGFASLALANLVRTMGRAGLGVQLRVNVDNISALAVMKKMGFKVIDKSLSVNNLHV